MKNTLKPETKATYIGHKGKFQSIRIENGRIKTIIQEDGKEISPDSLFTLTSYPKNGGGIRPIRSMSNMTITESEITFLTNNFNFIFFIDTNTKLINKRKISVGCLLPYTWKFLTSSKVSLECILDIGFFFFESKVSGEEKLSWKLCVQEIILNNPKISSGKIALFTDHDLGNHEYYNKRQKPILDNFFLPANVTLFYASSDRGTSEFPNSIFKKVEKESQKILKQLETTGQADIGTRIIKLEDIKSIF